MNDRISNEEIEGCETESIWTAYLHSVNLPGGTEEEAKEILLTTLCARELDRRGYEG